MSSSSQPSHDLEKQEKKKYLAYFNVAVVLIAVMFFEMVIINFSTLDSLSSVLAGIVFGLLMLKFVTLLTWFMHLRWEGSLIWVLFLSGLVLALGTVLAIMAIMWFGHHTLSPEEATGG